MFIIRGVNVFPSQIESALLTVPGVTANYLIILTTEKGMDSIEVQVEISPEAFSDQVKDLEALQKNISKAVESVIGLRIRVKLVAPQTIARSEGKAKRVLDQRIKN